MCLKVTPAGVTFVEDGPGVVRIGMGIDEHRESVGIVAEPAEVSLDLEDHSHLRSP